MYFLEMNDWITRCKERCAPLTERLVRARSFALVTRLESRVRALSLGDRLIFYVLAALVGITTLSALYTLEQSLLVSVPAHGGTLVEGEIGSPRFINPLLAITDADRDLSTLTYAGLMGLDGSGNLVPVLAESYTISPDGKTYTFTLRKDAKFSDGTPVTAADVVFTVGKAEDPGLKSPAYADWAGVGVEAVGTRTVRFTLSKPYAPFLDVTTLGILPAHLWQNVSDDEFPFSDLESNPVGAGPFVLSSESRDSSGLVSSASFSANPNYPLGRPYLSGIRFVFFSNASDLTRALSNGTVESAYGLPAATTQGSTKTLTAPYARVYGVFFNPSQNKTFAELPVREALSLGIDRTNIVQNVLGGYAEPLMGPVPPGSAVHETPIPSGNPTENAAAVLEKAGWTYDANARAWRNGKESLSSITIRTSNDPELKNVAAAVKADWEKLGISVDIELYEPGDLSQNVIRPRNYEALLFGEVVGRDQDLYAFWDSQEQNDPGLNIALYANKTVDALLEKARGESSTAARTGDLQQVEALVSADFPAAFTHAPEFTYTVPNALEGITLPQIATPSDRFASVASWSLVRDRVWPFFVKSN